MLVGGGGEGGGVCACCGVGCVYSVACVWCATLKLLLSSHVQIQNASVCTFKHVSVCTGNPSTCSKKTCGRVVSTRGDVSDAHTEA